MAQNVNPTFLKTPNFGAVSISTALTQSQSVNVYTGGTNGSKINNLMAVASTTAAFDVRWGISSGGTAWICGTVNVPGGAGIASVDGPAINLMSGANAPLPIDSDGNTYVFLPTSAHSLFTHTTAASSQWQAGSFIYVIATSVGDF